MRTWIFFLAMTAAATGCASAPTDAVVVDSRASLPSVQKRFAQQLSKIEIGMQVGAFNEILPEAYVAGQNGGVTAYEIADVQRYVTKADMNRQNFLWGVGSPEARAE